MSKLRRFHGEPVTRLIMSVPVTDVLRVDMVLRSTGDHPANGNRAEFVRIAITEKLARDLMICQCPPPDGPVEKGNWNPAHF